MTLVQSVKEKTGESTKIFLCSSFLVKKNTNLVLSRGLLEDLVLENFLYSIGRRNNGKEQIYLYLRFVKPQVEMRISFD